MKGAVEGVSKKMEKLIEFLEKRSPDEQKAAEMVEQRGGEAAVIEVSIRVLLSAEDLVTDCEVEE